MEIRRSDAGSSSRVGRRSLLRLGSLGWLGVVLGEGSWRPRAARAAAGAAPSPADPPRMGHPRLYFTTDDLPRLRGLRWEGFHARIWENLQSSAEACLKLAPRREWIAPVDPDPVYENLYERC